MILGIISDLEVGTCSTPKILNLDIRVLGEHELVRHGHPPCKRTLSVQKTFEINKICEY